ncbi:hypothetical protein J1614_007410 [Plenodomus biglobosus]|nr:hypothetical protein J1614_007410 [Plenodomus biglobosus]
MPSSAGSRCLALLALPVFTAAYVDYSQYVNVFQGTQGGGNRFPGVVAKPFAMVKLGPDVENMTLEAFSGYLPEGTVWGFSMMHESGTGGAPKYGVVSQMPVVGNVSDPLAELGQQRAIPDQGSVGYYRTSLANGVTVKLAASEHAGLYSYSFPSNSTSSIVVDVSHVLPSFRRYKWEQHYSGGTFSLFQDGHYEGHGIYNNGWNLSPDWTIYFCGGFNQQPIHSRVFSGNGSASRIFGNPTTISGSTRLGGVFTFAGSEIISRVGISFLSTEKACQNVDNEIPEGTDLSTLVQAARYHWNQDVFKNIQIVPSSEEDFQLLYSSLYGMFLIPSNRTGENPSWSSSEPYYDDIFTLWDTHRCHNSLFHIIQPTAYEEFIRSLIDIWRRDGFMPDARSSNYNGRVQVGSNADNVLADAYVKGLRGSINWTDGFAAMQTNAEVVPRDNFDPMAPDSSTKEGRGALPDWLKYGYITPRFSRAVSRSVEYSTNDFGLYQVALGLGKSDEAAKYLNRSRNWRNQWNSHTTSHNHTGFLSPRLPNGTFPETDPTACGRCYWPDTSYEDSSWIYSMNAIHDVGELKRRVGGDARFVDRLNKIFELGMFHADNEPSFFTPYLYNYVRGEQWRSVNRSRAIGSLYGGGDTGLPGNSDAGAMESNLLWQMIGLYPVTGQTSFLILAPWFKRMMLTLPNGATLAITTSGGHRTDAPYVQSLTVNGKKWDKAWLAWDDVFKGGGSMHFTLGREPVRWNTGDLPPSPAS